MLIGIDVGGTNIDGIVIESKKIIKHTKRPVDKSDLLTTINTCLLDLLDGIDKDKIERINLSTTISTNAIVEDKVDPVLMILQEGPGVNNNFDERFEYIEFLDGYVDHRGKLIKDFDEDLIDKIIHDKNYKDIGLLAVVTKFSTRNPEAENQIANKLANTFKNISLGHKMSGLLNFPRRVNSTYLNSAVLTIFSNFIDKLQESLNAENIKAPVYILKADGGTMKLEDALEKPVESILSGPAASFMGISALEDTKNDSIYIDIGGTTSDIFFLVDGSPIFEQKGIEIKEMKTLIRGIYSRSIGLGGDSCLEIIDGKIKIGPERKDKPIALGGAYPTLTDAMVCLNLLELGSVDLAKDAISKLAKEINMNLLDFSDLVLKSAANMLYEKIEQLLAELNSKPLFTVREVLENIQIKPEEIKIIGGPAKILAKYIEDKFQIPTKATRHSEVANAIGACLAKPTFEINLLADTKRKILTVPELDMYLHIESNFSQRKAEDMVTNLLLEKARDLSESQPEIEIVESSSFNMVDYYSFGKNIRIKGQIKPDLIYNLWSDNDEK